MVIASNKCSYVTVYSSFMSLQNPQLLSLQNSSRKIPDKIWAFWIVHKFWNYAHKKKQRREDRKKKKKRDAEDYAI